MKRRQEKNTVTVQTAAAGARTATHMLSTKINMRMANHMEAKREANTKKAWQQGACQERIRGQSFLRFLFGRRRLSNKLQVVVSVCSSQQLVSGFRFDGDAAQYNHNGVPVHGVGVGCQRVHPRGWSLDYLRAALALSLLLFLITNIMARGLGDFSRVKSLTVCCCQTHRFDC